MKRHLARAATITMLVGCLSGLTPSVHAMDLPGLSIEGDPSNVEIVHVEEVDPVGCTSTYVAKVASGSVKYIAQHPLVDVYPGPVIVIHGDNAISIVVFVALNTAFGTYDFVVCVV